MTVEELQQKDNKTINNYLNPSYRKYVPDIPWKSLVTYKVSADGLIPGDTWRVGNPVDYHDNYDTYEKGAFICDRGGIYTATQINKFSEYDKRPKGYPLKYQWEVTVIKQPITPKKVYAELEKDKVLMGNTGRHVAPADGDSPFGRAMREYMKPHTFTLVRCGRDDILGVAKRDNTVDIYNRNQKILTCDFDDITIADMLFSPNIKNFFFVLGEKYHRRSSLDFNIKVSEKQLIKVTMNNKDYEDYDIDEVPIPKRLTYDPLTINQDNDISLIGYEKSSNPQNDNEFAFTFTQDLEKKRCKTHQNEAAEKSCLQGCFSLQAIYYTNKDPISSLYLRHFPHLHALALKSNRSDKVIDLHQIPDKHLGSLITRDLNDIISASEVYSPDTTHYDPLLKKYFSEDSLFQLKMHLVGYLIQYRTNISDDNPNNWTNLVDHWDKLINIYDRDNLKQPVILGNIAEYSIISGNTVKHIVTSTPLGELWYQTHNKEQILISPIVEEVVEEAMEQEDENIDANMQPETSATVTQYNNLVLIQQKLDRFKKNVWTIAALPDKMKNLTAPQLCISSGSLSSFVSHPNKLAGFIHYREKNNNKEESRIKYVNLENNNNTYELSTKKYTRGIFTKNNQIAGYLRPQSWLWYIPYLLYPKISTFYAIDNYHDKNTKNELHPDASFRLFKTQSTWRDFFGRCKDVWHMMLGQL
jgi:hypothetical protein